jgi:hypothetical protein
MLDVFMLGGLIGGVVSLCTGNPEIDIMVE